MTRIAHVNKLMIIPVSCLSRRVTFPEKPKSSSLRGVKTHSFCLLFKGAEKGIKEREAAKDIIS